MIVQIVLILLRCLRITMMRAFSTSNQYHLVFSSISIQRPKCDYSMMPGQGSDCHVVVLLFSYSDIKPQFESQLMLIKLLPWEIGAAIKKTFVTI